MRSRCRLLTLLACCAAVAGVPSFAAGVGSSLRYSIQAPGTASGSLVLQYLAEREVQVDFEFTDRGRGPKLHERYRLAPGGFPLEGEISGRSYFGGKVEETFRLEGGTATWSRAGDRGSRSIEGDHFYFPASSSPGTLALLARAVLGHRGASLPALPSGTFYCEAVKTLTLERPGAQSTVSLYAVQGLSISPIYLWLDGDLDLFAFAMDPTTLVIREGWEAQGEIVSEQQRQSEDLYLERLTQRLRHPLPRLTVVRDVDVFDSLSGGLLRGVSVFIYRGRISAIFEGYDDELPEDALVIDGRGRTLLPGLWDMHHHAFPWGGLLYLAGGVTAIRDVGSSLEGLLRLERRYQTGEEIGPRVFRYGLIDQESPYSIPTGQLVKSLDEALAAVRRYAQYGYIGIKIYSSIDPAWVAPIAAESHRLGLRVGGHVPAFMTATEALRAGYDEINHANFLLLDLLVRPGDDTRTPLRYLLLADQASQIDLDAPEAQELLRLLEERQTVVDPTLAIFEHLYMSRPGEVSPVYREVADHLPVFLRRSLQGEQLEGSAAKDAEFRRAMAVLRELVKRLHDRGIPLVAGTDGPAAFALHRELENYVLAGIPAAEVLQIATLRAAEVVGAEHELGSVTPGKRADLILVEGDPTQDIGNLRRISLILQGEVYYRADEMYRSLGIQPFTSGADPVSSPGEPSPPEGSASAP